MAKALIDTFDSCRIELEIANESTRGVRHRGAYYVAEHRCAVCASMRRRKEEERVESTAHLVVFRVLLCQVERLPTKLVGSLLLDSGSTYFLYNKASQ